MSNKTKFKRLAMHSALALTLMATVAAPTSYTYADGVQAVSESVFDIPSIGSVSISNTSYFELKDVRLTAGTDQKTLTFTVNAVNNGTSDIQFIDYWVRVQSKAGAKFTVNVMPQDKDKNIIPAGSTQEIKFFANITPSLNLADLDFKIIKWDFSATDYQRILGSLTVPAEYTTVIPAGVRANMKIAKTNIQGYIKKTTISKNEENYLPSLLLELQNTDTRSLKLPALKFMIRTADGLMYPLQATGINENTTIDPLMKKEVALSAKLPRSITEEGWQLVITEVADTGSNNNVNVAVAEFVLPKATGDGISTETEQSFSNKDGTYVAKLDSVQRVPWEEEDLLSIGIILTSKESKSLPIPELTGYIKLDDSVKVDVKLIRTDNVIGLQPEKEVRLQLLGQIPYTYDFNEITVYLQEKEGTGTSQGTGTGSGGTGTVTDLVQFKINEFSDGVPLVNVGENIDIGGIGRSSNYSIHAVHKYPGKSSNVLTAQLEVVNLEKRANDLNKLVAHFKGSDGTMYPATINEVKVKIGPSGKALMYVWANVPANKTADITQLIVGEGVTDGKFTEKDGKPNAYVNAVSFFLPNEKGEANTIKDIDLFPYTLSLSKVGTSVNTGTITVSFDYDLEKDALYEVNSDDYKVVVELQDAEDKARLESTFAIEKSGQGQSGNANSNNTTLVVGDKKKMEVKITDQDFLFKATFLKKYKLNIYHLFQGEKKLVASKELDWFITSD